MIQGHSGRHNRKAFQVLMCALLLAILAVLSGLTQFGRSRTVTGWATKYRSDLVARDLVESAMEEATSEFMRQVNDPASALFGAARSLRSGPCTMVAALTATGALAREHPEVGSLKARVQLESPRPLVPGLEEDSDFACRMVVTAEAQVAEPAQMGIAGRQEREVRVTSIAPPRPLDKFGFMAAGVPTDRWVPAIEAPGTMDGLPLDPTVWERKATLRVDEGADGDVQTGFDILGRRLPELNGVVYVDNRRGRPLVLSNRRHRGKTVLVVRGPLKLTDVHLEEQGVDLLTVIAFGEVDLRGDLEAALILTGEASDPEPRRSIAPGTHIKGSLVVTTGQLRSAPGITLDFDTRFTFAGPEEEPVLADHLYVSVSPVLLTSRIETRG